MDATTTLDTTEVAAIEAVAASSLGGTFVLDTLGSLVDKSLIQSVEDRMSRRFSMLRMANP